jgi:uncharacterized protein YqeY
MTGRSAIRDRITADMRAAMKARDIATVAALRTLLGALDNAGAVAVTDEHKPTIGRSGDVPRRELTEDAIREILVTEAASRASSAEEFERHSRPDHATRLRTEVALIGRYTNPA